MSLRGGADRELLRGADQGLESQGLRRREEVAGASNSSLANGDVEDVDSLPFGKGDRLGFTPTVFADREADPLAHLSLSLYVRRRALHEHRVDPIEAVDGRGAFLPVPTVAEVEGLDPDAVTVNVPEFAEKAFVHVDVTAHVDAEEVEAELQHARNAVDVGVDLRFVGLAEDWIADLVSIAVRAAVEIVNGDAEDLGSKVMNGDGDARAQWRFERVDERIDLPRVERIDSRQLLVEHVLEEIHVREDRVVPEVGHFSDAHVAVVSCKRDDDVWADAECLTPGTDRVEFELCNFHVIPMGCRKWILPDGIYRGFCRPTRPYLKKANRCTTLAVMKTAVEGKGFKDDPKTQLWWCNVLHIFNGGYLTSLAILLPFVADDLGLNFSQSGLIKTTTSIAISAAQIPAGLAAERVGEILILGLGTAWFSLSYVAMLLVAGYPLALLVAFSAGSGGAAYHPVGTALIANVFPDEHTGVRAARRAYAAAPARGCRECVGDWHTPPVVLPLCPDPHRSGSAIGTLNCFGDVGKVIFPAATGMLVVAVGWRWSFAAQGVAGLVVSLVYLVYFRRMIVDRLRTSRQSSDAVDNPRAGRGSLRERLARWGIRKPRQFTLYTVIGFVDVAVRTAVTAFLGFVLIERGVEDQALGWLVSLTFFGGACGKLLCGMLVERWGSRSVILVTELLMILGCFAMPSMPLGWSLLLFLPAFGFVLNGTSSVIYIGLAPTFTREQRSRGYALYYTTNFFSTALSPFLFGLVGDAFGLGAIFFSAGLVMAAGLPLVYFMRDEGEEPGASTL